MRLPALFYSAVAYLVRKYGFDAGVVISASHNQLNSMVLNSLILKDLSFPTRLKNGSKQ